MCFGMKILGWHLGMGVSRTASMSGLFTIWSLYQQIHGMSLLYRLDDPDKQYCFASGTLPVECNESPSPSSMPPSPSMYPPSPSEYPPSPSMYPPSPSEFPPTPSEYSPSPSAMPPVPSSSMPPAPTQAPSPVPAGKRMIVCVFYMHLFELSFHLKHKKI